MRSIVLASSQGRIEDSCSTNVVDDRKHTRNSSKKISANLSEQSLPYSAVDESEDANDTSLTAISLEEARKNV